MNRKRKLIPHRIIPIDLYVLRDADRQLKSIIEDMASPGYVLVSRQMGKTNLLLNAKRTYQREEDVFTYIDLSNAFNSEYECFRNIIDKSVDTSGEKLTAVRDELRLIRNRNLPAHLEHLSELRTILRHIKGKMVIILDEIDALTRASFSDKIFSQIRSIYFERDSYPELERLTYILSGVVEPTEIIRDPKISPFNIGQKIFLDDFSFQEHGTFLKKANLDLTIDVSSRIFSWTSGNPRMTYDICSELEELIIGNSEVKPEHVDEVVGKMYLTVFDKAPIDHIRELAESSRNIRDAVTIIRYGKGKQLDTSTKTKLYLAGIIGSDFTSEHLGIKNRIIDESLSEGWIANIEKKSKDTDAMIVEASIKGDYQTAIDLYLKREAPEGKLANPTLYHVGVCYYKTAEFPKAIDILKMVDFDPKYERSYYFDKQLLLAESYWENRNEDMSIYVYEQIIDQDRDGTYYYLSIIALGRLYLDYEKGIHIPKSIEFFSEVINDIDNFKKVFEKDGAENLLVSVRMYYGIALGKLKQFDEAGHQLELAFLSSEPYNKPAILLAHRNVERSEERNLAFLNEILNIIYEEHLIPEPQKDSHNLLSNETIYTIMAEVQRFIPERVTEFYQYLLNEYKIRDGYEYSEGLLSIALIATSKANRELVIGICEFIIFQNRPDMLNLDVLHSAFQLLVVGGNPVLKQIPQLGQKYLDFLLSNRKYILNTLDFDILLAFSDNQIDLKNYDGAQRTISFLYDALEKAGENLKNSKYLIEYMEIKVLYSCEFKEAAKVRSQSLLNQINNLSQQEIHKNPLFKSIEYVKASLRSFQFPGLLNNIPAQTFLDNQRVNVRYLQNNRIIKSIKYKKVRSDIELGLCEIM